MQTQRNLNEEGFYTHEGLTPQAAAIRHEIVTSRNPGLIFTKYYLDETTRPDSVKFLYSLSLKECNNLWLNINAIIIDGPEKAKTEVALRAVKQWNDVKYQQMLNLRVTQRNRRQKQANRRIMKTEPVQKQCPQSRGSRNNHNQNSQNQIIRNKNKQQAEQQTNQKKNPNSSNSTFLDSIFKFVPSFLFSRQQSFLPQRQYGNLLQCHQSTKKKSRPHSIVNRVLGINVLIEGSVPQKDIVNFVLIERFSFIDLFKEIFFSIEYYKKHFLQ